MMDWQCIIETEREVKLFFTELVDKLTAKQLSADESALLGIIASQAEFNFVSATTLKTVLQCGMTISIMTSGSVKELRTEIQGKK